MKWVVALVVLFAGCVEAPEPAPESIHIYWAEEANMDLLSGWVPGALSDPALKPIVAGLPIIDQVTPENRPIEHGFSIDVINKTDFPFMGITGAGGRHITVNLAHLPMWTQERPAVGCPGPLLDPVEISRALFEWTFRHEFGHIGGLIGLPYGSERSHPEDPSHSSNPESAMWPGARMDLVQTFAGSCYTPLENPFLDEDDARDIREHWGSE